MRFKGGETGEEMEKFEKIKLSKVFAKKVLEWLDRGTPQKRHKTMEPRREKTTTGGTDR
ncbi:MAG: hypothetical protein ACTSWP_03705 [Candidatus Freyarchaeota archaeon]